MKTTKPFSAMTVREFAEMAYERGMTFVELLDEVGPIPTAPAGYTLASGVDDVWIGEDIVNRNYMLMPAWNAATNQRTVEVWTAKGTPDESYTHLTPLEALQLASDLIKLAKDALEG